MRVTIEKIVYPGRSLARADGKVIFTDQGIPGETVDVIQTADKKNLMEARTVNVVSASPDRRQARCDHFAICSSYQYIDYPLQVTIKQGQLNELLSRTLGMKDPKTIIRPAKSLWGYRNKVRLHVVWDGKKLNWAYHALEHREHYARIEKCALLSDQVNELLEDVRALLSDEKFKALNEVLVRESADKKKLLIGLAGDERMDTTLLAAALEPFIKKFPLSGVMYSTDGKYYHPVFGDDYLEEEIHGKRFMMGIDSFFQVNFEMAQQLITDMAEWLAMDKEKTVVDLYCGVGTFGIIFSDRVKAVVGVEKGHENIPFLMRNIEANGTKNYTVIKGDCEKVFGQASKRGADILIVDPPRRGLGDKLCRELVRIAPGAIAYVSCDPSTLVRDLKYLSGNYSLDHVAMYDFFPHTFHIETMAILRKRG